MESKEDAQKVAPRSEDTPKLATPKPEESQKSDPPKSEESEKFRAPQDDKEPQKVDFDYDAIEYTEDGLNSLRDHSIKQRDELDALKVTLSQDYIKRSDSSVYDLPSRESFSDDASHKEALDRYITSTISAASENAARYQAAQANLLTSIHRYNPSLLDKLDSLASIPTEAAYYLSGSPYAAELTESIIGNEKLLNALNEASPEQAKAYMMQQEGEMRQREVHEMQNRSRDTVTFFSNVIESLGKLTGGRMSQGEIEGVFSSPLITNGIMLSNSPVEMVAYLAKNPQISERLNKLTPEKMLYELGKTEGIAKVYTKSSDFRKIYPKSIDYKPDSDYKGNSSTPQGLHDGLSDGEWNNRYNKIKRKGR